MYNEIFSGARGSNFGLSFYLHPFFVHASSEGSCESVHCTDSPEPLLFDNAISTQISCVDPILYFVVSHVFPYFVCAKNELSGECTNSP